MRERIPVRLFYKRQWKGDTPEVLQRRVMEEAEWKIMPKAIDLIANGKVEVVNGLVKIKE